MIRVRSFSGKSYTMNDKAGFIELCNDDGEVGLVVFMKDNGEVQILQEPNPMFRKYIKSYKLKPTTVVDIDAKS